MLFNYLTLISALFISSVAIYYSVAGLATIFAASVVPVIIMGTALEVGKLIVAVWLHKNWRDSVWWLRWYLSVAVLVLMFITSMGIFGYLSKSHVEQAAADQETRAQQERVETNIARLEAQIKRSETKIKGYETNGSTLDASLQSQIDKEQERIKAAYERSQEQINQQLDIINQEEQRINNELTPFLTERDQIKDRLTKLDQSLANNDVRLAQGIVGTRPDGNYGPATAQKVEAFRAQQQLRIAELDSSIKEVRDRPNTIKVNAEQAIADIRATIQKETDASNQLIMRMRERVGQGDSNNVEDLIVEEQNKIRDANKELDTLVEQKYAMEAAVRKLEAEVGPIKYIAEFIYNEQADRNLLEEAVRWVIVVIIFVFDPLAVLLLIASQYSFERAREEEKARVVELSEQVLKEEQDIKEELKQTKVKLEEIIAEQKQKYEKEHGDWDEFFDQDSEWEWVEETVEEAYADVDITDRDQREQEHTQLKDQERVIANEYLRGEVDKAIKQKREGKPAILNRISGDYISYNGKTFQEKALMLSHPELNLDLTSPVASGMVLPVDPEEGTLFINCAVQPTKLMRFNGATWDTVDKNILKVTAYADDYINYLIESIANSEYNPELLNESEKRKIEILLTKEV